MQEKEPEKILILSGYFDPLHSGHIYYFSESKKLGGRVIVILNNEGQSRLKRGYHLIGVDERKKILESIKFIDEVFVSIDHGPTQCDTLAYLADKYKNKNCKLYFVKSGEWKEENLKEAPLCQKLGIKIKILNNAPSASSSSLIKKAVDLETSKNSFCFNGAKGKNQKLTTN